MTKRACPFDNHLVRQLKVHLNDYENDEKTLKDVQERTLTKLMDGSRRLHSFQSSLTHFANDHPDLNPPEQSPKESKLMQKSLTNYFPINGRLRDVKPYNSFKCSALTNCTFCDANDNALHRCIKCIQVYCSSCTFVHYDSTDDARICMSCS